MIFTAFVMFSLCACTLNININTGTDSDKSANSVNSTTSVNTTTGGNTTAKGNTDTTVTCTYDPSPFYGVWCAGSKSLNAAENVVTDLNNKGFDAQIFITTDWENLNSEMYYVVTAGVCNTKGEAEQLLSAVKRSGYTDAYVKYSGSLK